MVYMGSKRRYAKDIAPIIQKYIDKNGIKVFIDAFCGGGNLADKIHCETIIMNPPYSVIEPFVMKALGIADKGVLMLGRLQFLEGQGRYENIFKDYPPTDTYVYVDRISCYKNGDISIKQASVQAYAWFFWDLNNNSKDTKMHWIRRADKKEC